MLYLLKDFATLNLLLKGFYVFQCGGCTRRTTILITILVTLI